VLVVPDYWVGSTFYKFQSEKKALIETFVERKLAGDHPDLPSITDFFDYSETAGDSEEKGLFVYYLQEAKSYDIYRRLAELNIRPRKITTPAFLWNNKKQLKGAEFHKGGQCLVHMVNSDCFLYFFNHGRFLFSRSIALPESEDGPDEALAALNYEINQSIYLFSQKARSDEIKVHLLSAGSSNAEALSALMDRDVNDLTSVIRPSMDKKLSRRLSVISAFDQRDLGPHATFLSLTHSQLKKDLEWKPIQVVGILVGLIVLTLLCVESLFLHRLASSRNVRMTRSEKQVQIETGEAIGRYDQALDLMIKEAQRPSLTQTIMKTIKALPDGIQIRELSIDLENSPKLAMKGLVTADNPIEFKNLLSQFLAGLRINFEGSRALRIQNIDFETLENKGDRHLKQYLIQFGFDLP